jgi:hypothetical protein
VASVSHLLLWGEGRAFKSRQSCQRLKRLVRDLTLRDFFLATGSEKLVQEADQGYEDPHTARVPASISIPLLNRIFAISEMHVAKVAPPEACTENTASIQATNQQFRPAILSFPSSPIGARGRGAEGW